MVLLERHSLSIFWIWQASLRINLSCYHQELQSNQRNKKDIFIKPHKISPRHSHYEQYYSREGV